MRIFSVSADAETGEWDTDTLSEIGNMPREWFATQRDTADVHFDTFERDGETCGVEVHWVRA